MINFTRIKFAYQDLDAMIRCKSDTLKIVLIKTITICQGMVTSQFIKNITNTITHLHDIQRSQGNKGLVLYLKTCTVALQQAASGYILSDIGTVSKVRISRNGSGLPRIIPSNHRRIILSNQVYKYPLIKFYLTLFYLYRLITFEGKGDISSIIKGNIKGYMGKLDWDYFAKLFQSHLPHKFLVSPLSVLKKRQKDTFSIYTASPNRLSGDDGNDNYSLHATHPASISNSLLGICREPTVKKALIGINTLMDR
jgi:hypothetical protein